MFIKKQEIMLIKKRLTELENFQRKIENAIPIMNKYIEEQKKQEVHNKATEKIIMKLIEQTKLPKNKKD